METTQDNLCGICLKCSENFAKTTETNPENIKWCVLLAACVPEVDWSEEILICHVCVETLHNLYLFRNQCIKSSYMRSIKKEPKEEETSENESTNDLSNNVIEFCATNYDSSTNLEKSEQAESKEEFECFHCGETFISKQMICRHIRKTHDRYRVYGAQVEEDGQESKKQMKVKECKIELHELTDDKTTKRVQKPTTCRKKRDRNKTYSCPKCDAIFITEYLLQRHVRNVHIVQKDYTCKTCRQKFETLAALSRHELYHSGQKTFICSFCGKAYITAGDVFHHEKIHRNKREYQCEKCPKAFNTSSSLHKHKLCVHRDRNEWKYVCDYCQRRFPMKGSLGKHMKIHTGERNFACHLCDKKFISRSPLMRHVKTHSNVCPFKCDVCDQDYKHKQSLDAHLVKAHGIPKGS